MPPQMGMVIIHAQSILSATLHLIALRRLVAPVPITEPDMTWVVESGIPWPVAASITIEAVVCAENPCTGSSFTMFFPSVLMMRQPPVETPRAIVTAQTTLIHVAMSNCG